MDINKVEVGRIQAYPVYYVPGKDMVFCKNTICRVKDLKSKIYSSCDRELIEEKNLSIVKDHGSIYFGCLTTTIQNVREIERNINNFKTKNR